MHKQLLTKKLKEVLMNNKGGWLWYIILVTAFFPSNHFLLATADVHAIIGERHFKLLDNAWQMDVPLLRQEQIITKLTSLPPHYKFEDYKNSHFYDPHTGTPEEQLKAWKQRCVAIITTFFGDPYKCASQNTIAIKCLSTVIAKTNESLLKYYFLYSIGEAADAEPGSANSFPTISCPMGTVKRLINTLNHEEFLYISKPNFHKKS
jgi:hypothetical protein